MAMIYSSILVAATSTAQLTVSARVEYSCNITMSKTKIDPKCGLAPKEIIVEKPMNQVPQNKESKVETINNDQQQVITIYF